MHVPAEDPRKGARAVATFGEELPRIAQQFTEGGALGVVVLDVSSFARIEHHYGVDAYERVFRTFAALVRELLADQLSVEDLVVNGETGRYELLVLLFRDPGEVEFYKREFEVLTTRLAKELPRRGARVAYPYEKQLPRVELGTAAALRNPLIGADSQLRAALDQAREYAQMKARLESRRRRQRHHH